MKREARGVRAHDRPADPSTGRGAVVRVQDLSVEFDVAGGTIKAVDGLSYELYPGEVLAIIGESGSGKSVGAETLLGLVHDTPGCTASGSVWLRDRDLMTAGPREIVDVRGRELALVFQDPSAALNPTLTIGYQLAEVFQTRLGLSRREARRRSVEVLRSVGLPSPEQRMGDVPHQLSGGMRQRVMIGIAIALEPAVLVADEATTALDVTVQAEVMRLLHQLRERTDMAILFISHDLALATEIADRIGVMYAGRLVEIGPVDQLFGDPRHPYTKALLASTPTVHRAGGRFRPIGGAPPDPLNRPPGCPFHPRCEFAMDECRQTMPEFRALSGVRSIACHLPVGVPPAPTVADRDAAAPAGARGNGAAVTDTLLVVRDLRRDFELSGPSLGRRRTITAVKGVSFELHAQETLALVGESGSGKSTVARMAGRLLRPTGGTVSFKGADIWSLKRPALRALRRNIQMVFQDPRGSLDPRMTAGDAIREPWIVNDFGLSAAEQRRRLAGLLEDVGLREQDAGRRPAEFSGGQRQRIAIARALAMNPAILICDEPLSALDVSVQAQILNLLGDLQREYHIAYLFISHDLSVVRHLADRVAVMQHGELVEVGDVEDVYDSPAHPYTQTLLSAIPGRAVPPAVLSPGGAGDHASGSP